LSESRNFASYPSLRDRSVLITGGGSGIGAAVVEEFAMQGARVAFLDIAIDCSNELVAKLTGSCHHPPMFFGCDLTDIEALRVAISRVESELGALRVLVNNAASDDRHNSSDVTPEYWDKAMAVNLRHQFFAIQAVAPGMRSTGGGSIINMSSISWMVPSTGLPAYVTAKAAIVGLTRTMAHELGQNGIRVNAVLPGAILTERQRRLWRTPEYDAKIMASQCLKRTLTPEDVARLIAFLASDDSAAITNQSYVIDGGWV
jgi:NAD(P)-dependent dehydrogenase (short-subunit alcohol dehydrogenase family)